MSNNECTKCIHHPVCKTAESCDGYVSGCEHFVVISNLETTTKQKEGQTDVREKLVELFAVTSLEFEDAVTLADHLIAHGVTVQEWIPASEPPKDTYEYWIAYKAGGDYFYSTGYFDGKCWRSAITHKQIPVTHWQYLPQPPKGE